MSSPEPQSEEIRLGCLKCDRDDYDPTTIIKALADGWDIDGPSIEALPEDPDWWTHLGMCPDCKKELEEYRRSISGEITKRSGT
jgi:hypothetical protein